jgi:hypothetical protein
MALSDTQLAEIDRLKAWLKIPQDESAADVPLTELITRASGFILQYLGRDVLFAAAVTETRNGNGLNFLLTRSYPVNSVTSVTVDGAVIPQATSATMAGWVFSKYAIQLRGYYFNRGIQNVVLVMNAGVSAASAAAGILEQACMELCAQKWARRNREDMTVKAITGQTYITFSHGDMPAEVKTALQQLRNTAPGD